jgi:hypothetical protein
MKDLKYVKVKAYTPEWDVNKSLPFEEKYFDNIEESHMYGLTSNAIHLQDLETFKRFYSQLKTHQKVSLENVFVKAKKTMPFYRFFAKTIPFLMENPHGKRTTVHLLSKLYEIDSKKYNMLAGNDTIMHIKKLYKMYSNDPEYRKPLKYLINYYGQNIIL